MTSCCSRRAFCMNYCPQESDYAVLRRVGVLISALTSHLALRWKHKEAAPVSPSDQWLTTESRRLVWRAAADCWARHRNPTQTWHQHQPEASRSTSWMFVFIKKSYNKMYFFRFLEISWKRSKFWNNVPYFWETSGYFTIFSISIIFLCQCLLKDQHMAIRNIRNIWHSAIWTADFIKGWHELLKFFNF